MSLLTLIVLVRSHLLNLSPEKRLEIFDRLSTGYCLKCGEKCETTCYCERDE